MYEGRSPPAAGLQLYAQEILQGACQSNSLTTVPSRLLVTEVLDGLRVVEGDATLRGAYSGRRSGSGAGSVVKRVSIRALKARKRVERTWRRGPSWG